MITEYSLILERYFLSVQKFLLELMNELNSWRTTIEKKTLWSDLAILVAKQPWCLFCYSWLSRFFDNYGWIMLWRGNTKRKVWDNAIAVGISNVDYGPFIYFIYLTFRCSVIFRIDLQCVLNLPRTKQNITCLHNILSYD